MTTYRTIPTFAHLGLLARVKDMPGLRTFPIDQLAVLQDVPMAEALSLNTLCMKMNLPLFDWSPPLNADSVKEAYTKAPSEPEPGPITPETEKPAAKSSPETPGSS